MGGGYEELYAIRQTSYGGYILGGTSGSDISGEKTGYQHGGGDVWIVKLDKTVGGNDRDGINAIRQTSDGGDILGCFSYSGISGEKTDALRGESGFWVVKPDPAIERE